MIIYHCGIILQLHSLFFGPFGLSTLTLSQGIVTRNFQCYNQGETKVIGITNTSLKSYKSELENARIFNTFRKRYQMKQKITQNELNGQERNFYI